MTLVPAYSRSLYYGKRQSANAFPAYTTAELERTLQSASLDGATRIKIDAELARRAGCAS
jgi:hypothetical protein